MDKMTQQNAAMVAQSAASSRSLATEAHALNALVSKFVMKEDDGPACRSSNASGAGDKFHALADSKYGTAISIGNMVSDTNPDDDWSEF